MSDTTNLHNDLHNDVYTIYNLSNNNINRFLNYNINNTIINPFNNNEINNINYTNSIQKECLLCLNYNEDNILVECDSCSKIICKTCILELRELTEQSVRCGNINLYNNICSICNNCDIICCRFCTNTCKSCSIQYCSHCVKKCYNCNELICDDCNVNPRNFILYKCKDCN